jgi:hypothetical protein
MVPVATPATAGQRTAYVRHPGDVIRVALGAVLVAACSVIAALESVSGVEASRGQELPPAHLAGSGEERRVGAHHGYEPAENTTLAPCRSNR